MIKKCALLLAGLIIVLTFSCPSFSREITLEEAINIALRSSPALLMEQQQIQESREDKKASKAASFGTISLMGSYTHYNIPHTLAPITPPISPTITTSKDITSGGIIYSITLFKGLADITSIKIASFGEEISKIRFRLTKEELIFNIRSIYLKILSLKSQEKAARAYKRAIEELYKNVSREVSVGRKAEIDLLKISSQLEEASFEVEKIKNSISSLETLLAATIGIEGKVTVEPVSPEKILSSPCGGTGDITHTYQYRLSRLEAKKARENLKKVRSRYYPRLDFDVYFGNNYARGDRKEIWQAQVSLKWLLFDFGATRSRVKRASFAARKATLALKKTMLELKSRICDAREKISTAMSRLESLKRQIKFLSKVRSVEKLRYEKGISNMYDLLLAYASLQKAKSTYIGAKYDLYIQRLYLSYIMAGVK